MAYQKKRPEDRIGNPHYARGDPRNDGPGGQGMPVSTAPSRRQGIPIPNADPKWKPEARSWFNSLKLSGQSAMFEASDWATAVAAAQAYDTFLRTWNASIFAQFSRLSERLGATFADRQRARIDLSEPEPADADDDAADAAVLGWHSRLGQHGHHGMYVVPDPDDG
jgi:hypothetical protein